VVTLTATLSVPVDQVEVEDEQIPLITMYLISMQLIDGKPSM
jgi:hypothetical protein